jgi:hypothetical protein
MNPSASFFAAKEKVAGLPAPRSIESSTVDQATANYRGPEVRCSNCEHFDGVNACAVVEGEINPEGNSDRFVAKADDGEDRTGVDVDGDEEED